MTFKSYKNKDKNFEKKNIYNGSKSPKPSHINTYRTNKKSDRLLKSIINNV